MEKYYIKNCSSQRPLNKSFFFFQYRSYIRKLRSSKSKSILGDIERKNKKLTPLVGRSVDMIEVDLKKCTMPQMGMKRRQ